MSFSRTMILVFAVAGCADSPPPQMIPGVVVDAVASAPGALLASRDLHPCGYDHRFESVGTGVPLGGSHEIARISYDDRGLNVLETAVDDSNAFAFSYATEYNAMGDTSHYRYTSAGYPPYDVWMVYDSFGRLSRLSIDGDGDGTEEDVFTYGYGNDNLRTTSHTVSTRGTYDRAYRYDAQGRLVELDRDDGPDGVIDRHSVYVYDDPGRTMTMTMTGPSGAVLETETTHYDDAYRLVSIVGDRTSPDDGPQTSTETDTYDGDRLSSMVYVLHSESQDGAFVYDLTNRYDWHYDQCQ